MRVRSLRIIVVTSVISIGSLAMDSFPDTVPMAVLEKDGDRLSLLRCNRSYGEYLRQIVDDAEISYAGGEILLQSPALVRMAEKVQKSEDWVPVRERNDDGRISRSFARRIAVNPVTGASAIVLVVLAIL